MKYPINVAMPSGAVSLGPNVVCDGFLLSAKVRVQTHVHIDHMDRFETSKGKQQIIASEPTLKLLIAEFRRRFALSSQCQGSGSGSIP